MQVVPGPTWAARSAAISRWQELCVSFGSNSIDDITIWVIMKFRTIQIEHQGAKAFKPQSVHRNTDVVARRAVRRIYVDTKLFKTCLGLRRLIKPEALHESFSSCYGDNQNISTKMSGM